MNALPKHIHVIGICGVAMSAVAIAFKEKGVSVTGCDKGFYPPVSTELDKHRIAFYAGWHPEKMIAEGAPDCVIVGAASGSRNPETLYAKDHDTPIYSYPEAIGRYFAKENSIVCAGTWGKTSSSALLSFILAEAGYDPAYMFGGVSLSHGSSARLTDSRWSVFEGDEYRSSPTDPKAKFFYYKPTHLLLSAVSWDHADLYPTESEYFEAFRKLLPLISKKGFIVACADNPGVAAIIQDFKGRTIMYGLKSSAGLKKYLYGDVVQSKNGLDLIIESRDSEKKDGQKTWKIHSPMLGLFQAENICGCFAMAQELGVESEKITAAVSKFKGLKRRMEKRFEGDITVIDDIAHSPEKAAVLLKTLREIYKGKIIAVFEPNIGGRSRESVSKYDDAFKGADTVIIPRLTKLKVAENAGDVNADQPMEGPELAACISKTHPNARYFEEDKALIDYVISNAKKNDVIVFLGSHGFRGMIEEVVRIITNKQ